MEYGWNFDNDSPRYSLNSLWFLLGVMVFAFTVLIMATIVNGTGPRDAHISGPTTRQSQQAQKISPPAPTRFNNPAPTPRPLNNKGG